MGCRDLTGVLIIPVVAFVGLGLVGLLTGFALDGWAEVRLWCFLTVVWALLSAPFLIPLFVSRRREASRAAAKAERRRRLAHPDFAAGAVRLGGIVPADVRALYEDRELVCQEGIELYRPDSDPDAEIHEVANFVPIQGDPASSPDRFPADLVPIARDSFGNVYGVHAGEAAENGTPVYFWDHDGGDLHDLQLTVGELFALPHRKPRGKTPPDTE